MIQVILIGLVDVVIPVPILGIILIVVVVNRPPWFRELVDDIYGERSSEA